VALPCPHDTPNDQQKQTAPSSARLKIKLIGCATMTLRRAIVTLAVIAAALAVLRYVTNNQGG
jgi:hypothetical protein